MAEDIKKAKTAGDPKAEKLAAEFKTKLGKLSADGKAMKERHPSHTRACEIARFCRQIPRTLRNPILQEAT